MNSIIQEANKFGKVVGKYPHRYKVLYRNESNQHVFDQLRLDGFFDLHVSNKGEIISIHQIVAFYKCGGIHAMRRGYVAQQGQIEVHHLDGNGLNNSSSNLRYVSVEIHNFITRHQKYILKYIRLFKKGLIDQVDDEVLLWNSRGKEIKNKISYAMVLLVMTMKKTALSVVGVVLPNLRSWLKQVRNRLEMGAITVVHSPDLLNWLESYI